MVDRDAGHDHGHSEGGIDDSPVCPHGRSSGRCSGCQVRSISVCAALRPDELDALADIAVDVTFADRAAIFQQGETAAVVYNIIEGTVRLYRLLPDGRRQILGFLLPGDLLWVSLSERSSFGADAIEPVRACRFSREDFVALADAKPSLLKSLHAVATHELSLAQDHMVLLGRRGAEEKVAAFLLALRVRLGRLGRSQVTLPLPMTRQDIADYLGLTLETVSRCVSKLARERAILNVPGGVRVLDLAKLEALAAN